jgi:hypothetical protein
VLVLQGEGRLPGGYKHDPPEACGIGEWDKVGGVAGEGAQSEITGTRNGNAGAIRIMKPGYY